LCAPRLFVQSGRVLHNITACPVADYNPTQRSILPRARVSIDRVARFCRRWYANNSLFLHSSFSLRRRGLISSVSVDFVRSLVLYKSRFFAYRVGSGVCDACCLLGCLRDPFYIRLILIPQTRCITRTALNRAHTCAKCADPAKLITVTKRLVKLPVLCGIDYLHSPT